MFIWKASNQQIFLKVLHTYKAPPLTHTCPGETHFMWKSLSKSSIPYLAQKDQISFLLRTKLIFSPTKNFLAKEKLAQKIVARDSQWNLWSWCSRQIILFLEGNYFSWAIFSQHKISAWIETQCGILQFSNVIRLHFEMVHLMQLSFHFIIFH